MLYIPSLGYREVQTNLAATPSATVPGTSATGGAAHTKGSWAPLFTATNFETEWITLMVSNTYALATRTDALLDIGIGAALSEQVILPNLLAGWAGHPTNSSPRLISMPFYIPKGARVAARAQGLQASKVVNVTMWLYGGARQPVTPTFSQCDAIGVTAASSIGTSITSGNTGVEGTWTNVGSVTARPYRALLFMVQGTMATTVTTNLGYHFEVGYSSTTLAEFYVGATASEYMCGPYPEMPIYQSIPTGTQLQVRGESSGTAQAIDVALYGLY